MTWLLCELKAVADPAAKPKAVQTAVVEPDPSPVLQCQPHSQIAVTAAVVNALIVGGEPQPQYRHQVVAEREVEVAEDD